MMLPIARGKRGDNTCHCGSNAHTGSTRQLGLEVFHFRLTTRACATAFALVGTFGYLQGDVVLLGYAAADGLQLTADVFSLFHGVRLIVGCGCMFEFQGGEAGLFFEGSMEYLAVVESAKTADGV